MKKAISVATFGITILPLLVFAQISVTGGPQTVPEVYALLRNIFTIILTIFWILAGIFIIFAAFKYLTAGGAPDKVKGAQQMLIYAVVAIVIALLATGIRAIVASLIGVTVTGG